MSFADDVTAALSDHVKQLNAIRDVAKQHGYTDGPIAEWLSANLSASATALAGLRTRLTEATATIDRLTGELEEAEERADIAEAALAQLTGDKASN